MANQANLAKLFQTRVTQFQAQLSPNQVCILSQPHDVYYFSGFEILVPEEREAFLILTSSKAILQHAAFSPHDTPLDITTEAGVTPTNLATTLENLVQDFPDLSKVLIDEHSLFVSEYKALPATLAPQALDRKLVWQVRMTKDEHEQTLLQQAGQIAATAYHQVVGPGGQHLKPGITELELASQLEHAMRELGASDRAFPTIVAFGPNGALPHYQPKSVALTNNMPVLIDFGATYHHYRSDMTRSFWFGPQPAAEFQEISQLVEFAYQATLTLLRQTNWTPANQTSWPTAQDLDAAARSVISKAGFGPQFIHTTGHGLGLDIHEQPSLSWRNQTPLRPSMAITSEPGIYLPNKFGYRYENTLLLTESGPEILTQVSSN